MPHTTAEEQMSRFKLKQWRWTPSQESHLEQRHVINYYSTPMKNFCVLHWPMQQDVSCFVFPITETRKFSITNFERRLNNDEIQKRSWIVEYHFQVHSFFSPFGMNSLDVVSLPVFYSKLSVFSLSFVSCMLICTSSNSNQECHAIVSEIYPWPA